MRIITSSAVLLTAITAVVWQSQPVEGQAKPIVRLQGSITSNQTLTADNDYLLVGAVFVRPPATLTIEPGTTIYGEQASNGTLVISRGARIEAEGTRTRPIVFTSDQEPGTRARADWGGLIINGFAPLNVPGGTALGEGDTGRYGGNRPNDNSGTLRFVRVEFAGTEFSPDNELNGIAFQGVGNQTTAEFLQVHFNKDDGVEFFGGTANLRFTLVTFAADDSFDWTDGWTGKGQFWIAHQRGDDANNGFESDNNGENNNLSPRSNPTIYNITLIGDPTTRAGSESDNGMLLRAGTGGTIANAIVMGFKESGVNIDDAATFTQAGNGTLRITSSIFFRNNPNFSNDASDTPRPSSTTATLVQSRMPNNRVVNPKIRVPFNYQNPDYRPRGGNNPSAAVDGRVRVAVPPNDGFFQAVTFIGAMGPEEADDWTDGWTTYEQN